MTLLQSIPPPAVGCVEATEPAPVVGSNVLAVSVVAPLAPATKTVWASPVSLPAAAVPPAKGKKSSFWRLYW